MEGDINWVSGVYHPYCDPADETKSDKWSNTGDFIVNGDGFNSGSEIDPSPGAVGKLYTVMTTTGAFKEYLDQGALPDQVNSNVWAFTADSRFGAAGNGATKKWKVYWV